MATVKIHNPELAKKSVFKNLILEPKTQDPDQSELTEGMIWYDVSNNNIKSCVPDVNGDPIVKTVDAVNDLSSLDSKLDGEISDRDRQFGKIKDLIDGTNGIQSKISTATNTFNKMVGELTNIDSNLQNTSIVDAINDLYNKVNSYYTNFEKSTLEGKYLKLSSSNTQIINGDIEFNGEVTINGDFKVEGTITEISSTDLKVDDTKILLNSDYDTTKAPSEDVSIEINRGSEGYFTLIKWDEAEDKIKIGGIDSNNNTVLYNAASEEYVDNEISILKNDIYEKMYGPGKDPNNPDGGLAKDVKNINQNIQNSGLGDPNNLKTTSKKVVDAINELYDTIEDDTVGIKKQIESLNTELSTKNSTLTGDIGEIATATGIDSNSLNYVVNNNAKFIKNATSLADADNKLDNAINSLETNIKDTADSTHGSGMVGYSGYTNSNANAIISSINPATVYDVIGTLADTINDKFNNVKKCFVHDYNGTKSYNVTHNLNTNYVSVDVYVDDNGVYKKEIVEITIIDQNNIKIDLSDVANIRVVIEGY